MSHFPVNQGETVPWRLIRLMRDLRRPIAIASRRSKSRGRPVSPGSNKHSPGANFKTARYQNSFGVSRFRALKFIGHLYNIRKAPEGWEPRRGKKEQQQSETKSNIPVTNPGSGGIGRRGSVRGCNPANVRQSKCSGGCALQAGDRI